MQIPYKRLSSAEREEISLGRDQGESMTGIAKRLDRAVSTISGECDRSPGQYRAHEAGKDASIKATSRKKGRTKLAKYPILKQYVESKLGSCWSPAQIAERLKTEYPLDMTCASHRKPCISMCTSSQGER